jgi:3-phosphoshikimate 1-carboxyvinyltransferase
LDGLNQIGVLARSINNTGCPPVEIVGDKIKGGPLTLQCSLSSQFLSSIMLIAPYTQKGIEIKVAGELVSKPYVDMTVDIMERLGVSVVRDRYLCFKISGNQVYKAGAYEVEPDCSQASYFWAAAAVTGNKIKVKGISKDSRQGDVRFAKVLESMGCVVTYDEEGIAVMGKELFAVEVDMSDMPDIVPSLAVVAAFAKGTTIIKNVAHLKEKECDRLGSVVAELIKIGIDARATDTGMIITGKKPNDMKIKRVEIETYNDHRMAMSFAVAGLVLPGIVIKDENCVKKSFPNFWDVFKGMY